MCGNMAAGRGRDLVCVSPGRNASDLKAMPWPVPIGDAGGEATICGGGDDLVFLVGE